jgi:hypothetical protein
MFSKALEGTSKRKTTMNWFEYYFGHCFQTGWREMWNNFKMWRDLISGNYENYALLPEDDPYEECYQWFWTSINLDETYPKEFLEYLMELCDKIDRGEEKVYPMDEVIERVKNLVEDVELDDDDI